MCFPDGSVVKHLSAKSKDADLIPGLGRSSGEEYGNPFQYSCSGKPIDRGAWWAKSMALQGVRCNLASKQQQQIFM